MEGRSKKSNMSSGIVDDLPSVLRPQDSWKEGLAPLEVASALHVGGTKSLPNVVTHPYNITEHSIKHRSALLPPNHKRIQPASSKYASAVLDGISWEFLRKKEDRKRKEEKKYARQVVMTEARGKALQQLLRDAQAKREFGTKFISPSIMRKNFLRQQKHHLMKAVMAFDTEDANAFARNLHAAGFSTLRYQLEQSEEFVKRAAPVYGWEQGEVGHSSDEGSDNEGFGDGSVRALASEDGQPVPLSQLQGNTRVSSISGFKSMPLSMHSSLSLPGSSTSLNSMAMWSDSSDETDEDSDNDRWPAATAAKVSKEGLNLSWRRRKSSARSGSTPSARANTPNTQRSMQSYSKVAVGATLRKPSSMKTSLTRMAQTQHYASGDKWKGVSLA